MIRNTWYVAGFSDELPIVDVQRHVIAGHPIVMWRLATGSIAAFDGRAPTSGSRCGRASCWMATSSNVSTTASPPIGLADASSSRPARRFRSHARDHTATDLSVGRTGRRGLALARGARACRGGCSCPGHRRSPVLTGRPADLATPVEADARLLIENLFDLTHVYPLHAWITSAWRCVINYRSTRPGLFPCGGHRGPTRQAGDREGAGSCSSSPSNPSMLIGTSGVAPCPVGRGVGGPRSPRPRRSSRP